MKSMGLELPGMGEGGAVGAGDGREGRKKEALMREARYGIGSVLVDEGAAPTMVFVIVEGECRIIKSDKRCSQSHPAGESKQTPMLCRKQLKRPMISDITINIRSIVSANFDSAGRVQKTAHVERGTA